MVKELHGHVVTSGHFILLTLPKSSNVTKLLQRVRDESHRFAVSYHSSLKTKRMTVSTLEQLPGIGPSSAKKLLKEYGSIKAISESNLSSLTKSLGATKAEIVLSFLNAEQQKKV